LEGLFAAPAEMRFAYLSVHDAISDRLATSHLRAKCHDDPVRPVRDYLYIGDADLLPIGSEAVGTPR
jgi:hypothetical protein